MATKAELEVRVAELEAQLAAATVATPDPVVTPVDQAESDLIQGLKDQVTGLQLELAGMTSEKEALVEQVSQLEKELALARDFRDSQPAPAPARTGNLVVLDGVEYPVVHRNTVRELVQDFHKKEVDENHTAVVITKTGG